MYGTGATTRGRPIEAAGVCDCPDVDGGVRLACAWAFVDLDGGNGTGAAGCAEESGVMMLTGGMADEVAKSIEVGRPEGTPVSRLAAAEAPGAAAAVAQDGEWRAISVS